MATWMKTVRRAVDTNISITAHESEDAYTFEATTRGFKKMEPFVIKWEYPLMVRDDCMNPNKLRTALQKKAVYSVDDLVKIIAAETMTTKKLRETAMKDTGMSRSFFYELIPDLKNTAGITFNEQDKTWSYTRPSVHEVVHRLFRGGIL